MTIAYIEWCRKPQVVEVVKPHGPNKVIVMQGGWRRYLAKSQVFETVHDLCEAEMRKLADEIHRLESERALWREHQRRGTAEET